LRLIALSLLLLYWILSLDSLAIVPSVGQDEPWVAAAPVKLATQGVLGSDLFTGYYGMERHHYQHPPLFPVLQAGVFRAIGVGVWQMRVLPVALGLLVLALTYAVGKQLADERTGTCAHSSRKRRRLPARITPPQPDFRHT
jgi:4-amino-4-deoxy-L-arabinose transferase-like glycosyltransferase